MLSRLINITAYLIFASAIYAQEEDSVSVGQVSSFSSRYYDKLSEKINGLEHRFDKQTEKYLRKIEKQELRLYRKLWEKDSSKAKELFGDVSSRYKSLQSAAAERAKHLSNFSKVYSGKLDSLSTAFSFLQNSPVINPELQSKLKEGLRSINGLKGKLNETDQIRKFLKERKKMLAGQLEKYGLAKELKRYNKQIFYYSQQIKEYKEILDNPAKLEEKLLGLLARIPSFRNFFDNHSQLASLFRLPGSASNNNAASLAGLQTRASVMQDLQNRFGSASNVQQLVQQNINSAQGQLNDLKNKVNQYMPNGGSSDDELPNFKPNNQKTKSFWQRVELGSNFQNQRSRGLLPVTSDIGLSAGYKLNDKSIIGVGMSYKLGWGQDIRNIKLSSQGAGLRSFIDVKLKGSFWISGGYEMNYQSGFNRIEALKNFSAWQQSSLIGLSKVVSLKTKFFKKTKMQLLWDFLSYQQVPRTQSVLFRIGYGIK